MLHESLVVLAVWPQVSHRQFVELWHVYHFDGTQGQKFLFTCNYLPQEILVAHQSWRCVPLDCTKGKLNQSILTLLAEVIQEIVLALEPVDELIWQVALLADSPWIRALTFLFDHKRYYLRMLSCQY